MSTASPLLLLAAFVCALALAVGNAAAPVAQHERMVRWHLYKTEHRISTNLGRRVRALRRDVRWLRQQLAHARQVQAVGKVVEKSPALPHLQAWLCIHSHEGAWDANTGNGYYGGLQMDIGFQQAYGPELLQAEGTADHWTPEEQMAVAERAYASGRGFYPWPTTARMCGLI